MVEPPKSKLEQAHENFQNSIYAFRDAFGKVYILPIIKFLTKLLTK